MVQVCGGPCNAAWRRAHQAGAEPGIQPWPGDPVFCSRCGARIRRCLAELDDLAALLQASADGHRASPDGERVSGSAHAPSPSPAIDEVDELHSVLADWESAYRQNEYRAYRGDLASALTTVIAWLIAHLDGILASAVAEDFGREVLQWHRRLCQLAKAGTERHRKPHPCPRCDQRLLTWREGDRHVECGNPDCRRLLSLDEYEDYASYAEKDTPEAA